MGVYDFEAKNDDDKVESNIVGLVKVGTMVIPHSTEARAI